LARATKGLTRSKKVEPLFEKYKPIYRAYDEFVRPSGRARPAASKLLRALDKVGQAELKTRHRIACGALLNRGITFSVYSDVRGVERIFPLDIVPRVIDHKEWDVLHEGLIQRVGALNAFLADIYGPQRILKEKIIPREFIENSAGFLPELMGIKPRGGVYVHIGGIDLIRDEEGRFLVLEDNVRTPSGVSYVLENRSVMKRVMPDLLSAIRVRNVDDYPARLRKALTELSPVARKRTRTVVLTPGSYNSAYFEHSYLAMKMGCDLAYPSDLFVHDDKVYLKTTAGPQRVHVIYRRIDDDFIDPTVFRKDSLLGVPGLVRAYSKGNVTLANALGNGVCDDKAIYAYTPQMIRFYLDEAPILGQVETYICARDEDRQKTLDQLDQLVVKRVDGAGGYGMTIGPQSTRRQLADCAAAIKADPRAYIAQPLIQLSACPTLIGDRLAPRRVDLRPYVVTGKKSWVLPGGLSRVALPAGSFVVNSSQGGGSKDTWVLDAPAQ
jgi:uncharacterized circularly permuted ATP-grasp superfamily protein